MNVRAYYECSLNISWMYACRLGRQIYDPINPFVLNVPLLYPLETSGGSERVHWERISKISMMERFGEIAELMVLIQ